MKALEALALMVVWVFYTFIQVLTFVIGVGVLVWIGQAILSAMH